MVTAVSQIVSLPKRVPKSEFVAGRLSLAFCNTLPLPDAADRLGDEAGIAAWADRAGHPLPVTPDSSDYYDFHKLRDLLVAIFGPLAHALPPPQAALDQLSALAAPPRLVWDDQSYRATPTPTGDAIGRLRQAIIADAVDLLTGTALERIKRCPAHDCRWFFFDTSRNATRRWCAMADCGTKDKVQRYRDRSAAF